MRFLSVAALLFAASSVHAAPEKFALDPDHTVVAFTVTHVGYSRVLGVFGEVSGTFVYDTDAQILSDVSITIAAVSVDTFHDARNEHVNKGDFLNTSAFPEIKFTAAGGTPTGANTGTVTGDLTLLGQTHPVTLNVTLNKSEAYPFGHRRFVQEGQQLRTSSKPRMMERASLCFVARSIGQNAEAGIGRPFNGFDHGQYRNISQTNGQRIAAVGTWIRANPAGANQRGDNLRHKSRCRTNLLGQLRPFHPVGILCESS